MSSPRHGFRTVGIQIDKGHECHVTDSFLGQYWWGEHGADGHGTAAFPLTATAVVVAGQDHWISGIVVFAALVGVELQGGAAVVTNTHIYNGGGASLVVTGQSNRIIGCYFDFDAVILIDPVAVEVAHSFFLGGVGVEVRSSGQPGAFVAGLSISNNQFVSGSADGSLAYGVVVNETAGAFASVNGTVSKMRDAKRSEWRRVW